MELPDIHALIALFDPKHIHHEPAQTWFTTARTVGWATCPLTENGFLRIVSNPSYANLRLSITELAAGLRTLFTTYTDNHQLYTDYISLCDTSLFDLNAVQGYRQLTDLYLLGLCQQRRATLVTFDEGIQQLKRAIITARPDLVRLLVP
ncbi:MAG TPA: TA system VapC family ribonuclease toxin [Chthonomonadaceae bacterium]|nr:TA system VapC family ribonuclease toxin [Chthonomonadaceae bacterium]